jgi:hypothetical protein
MQYPLGSISLFILLTILCICSDCVFTSETKLMIGNQLVLWKAQGVEVSQIVSTGSKFCRFARLHNNLCYSLRWKEVQSENCIT